MSPRTPSTSPVRKAKQGYNVRSRAQESDAEWQSIVGQQAQQTVQINSFESDFSLPYANTSGYLLEVAPEAYGPGYVLYDSSGNPAASTDNESSSSSSRSTKARRGRPSRASPYKRTTRSSAKESQSHPSCSSDMPLSDLSTCPSLSTAPSMDLCETPVGSPGFSGYAPLPSDTHHEVPPPFIGLAPILADADGRVGLYGPLGAVFTNPPPEMQSTEASSLTNSGLAIHGHLQDLPSSNGKQRAVRWDYRKIFETVTFPPKDAPHEWLHRISVLATHLKMPPTSTGEEIITVVMLSALLQGEREEAEQILQSITVSASPENQAMICRILSTFQQTTTQVHSTVDPSQLDGHNTSAKRSDGEASSGPPGFEGNGDDEVDEPDEAELADNETSPRSSQRVKDTEEDLHCRVGSCPKSFKDPRSCHRHRRAAHSPRQWECPGPCGVKQGTQRDFVSNRTLKCHLCRPDRKACYEKAMEILNLDAMPDGDDLSWMAPLSQAH